MNTLRQKLVLGAFFFTMVGLPCQAEGNAGLRVGISISLSGPTAAFGEAVRNGIELARIEQTRFKQFRSVQEDHRQDIQFHYSDNRYDPKTAISGFNKLLSANSIDFLFIWGDAVSTAVAPLANRQKVPTVAVLTNPKPVRHLKHVIRFANYYEHYTAALLKHLRAQNVKRIGMVVAEGSYCMNMLEGMRQQLHADEQLEVLDNYRYEEHDFRLTVNKLQSRSYDALGVFLMPGQVSAFYRQLAQAGLSPRTFGSDTFASRIEAREARGAMTAAVYAYHDVEESFLIKYLSRFGNDLQIMYAANAYEFARLLYAVVEKESGTADRLLAALRAVGSRESVLGQFAYHNTEMDGAHFAFPIVIKKVPAFQ